MCACVRVVRVSEFFHFNTHTHTNLYCVRTRYIYYALYTHAQCKLACDYYEQTNAFVSPPPQRIHNHPDRPPACHHHHVAECAALQARGCFSVVVVAVIRAILPLYFIWYATQRSTLYCRQPCRNFHWFFGHIYIQINLVFHLTLCYASEMENLLFNIAESIQLMCVCVRILAYKVLHTHTHQPTQPPQLRLLTFLNESLSLLSIFFSACSLLGGGDDANAAQVFCCAAAAACCKSTCIGILLI